MTFGFIRRHWGKGLLILVGLGLLGGTGFMTFIKIKFANFQPPFAAPGVIVTKVEGVSFSDRIEAIGTAEANESAVLTATVTETVKSIVVPEGGLVKAGTVIVELSDDEERATVTEAQKSFDRYQKLASTQIGSVAQKDQEEARMNVAKAQLNKRLIVAPFDGVVGIRQVSVGDLVSPGTVITTIDALDPIKLEFTVPEGFLSVLKLGLAIEARSEAYPGEKFTGVISAVDSRINPETRAIRVNASLPNADARLRPGLLMHVDIVKNTRTSLAVPEEALLSAGEKKTVLVVGADKKAESREVQLGVREMGKVEILSGLKEGESVIVEGTMKAQSGGEVVVVGEKTIEGLKKEALDFSVSRKQEALKETSEKGEASQGVAIPQEEGQ